MADVHETLVSQWWEVSGRLKTKIIQHIKYNNKWVAENGLVFPVSHQVYPIHAIIIELSRYDFPQ